MPAVPNLRRAGLNALVERQVDRVAAADATPADDSNVVVNPKNRQRPMSVESTVITINEPTVMTIIPTVVITQTVTATVEDIETTSPTEPASTRTKTRTRTRTRTRTTETESQELSTSTIVLSTSYVVQETTDALSTSTILPSPTATSEVFDGSAPTGVKVISPGDEVTTTVQDSSVEAPQASETSAAVESTLAETVMEPMPTATSSIEDLSIETALLASSTAPEISGDANATASSELSGTAGTAGATAQPSISISSAVEEPSSSTTTIELPTPSEAAQYSETVFGGLSTRIAAVATSPISSESPLSTLSLASESEPSPAATSAPIRATPTAIPSDEPVFSILSSRIRAVETSASIVASRSSELASASRSIESAVSSLSSAVAAASSLSSVLASKSESVYSDGPHHDGPTPAPNTIADGAQPTQSVKLVTKTNADGSVVVSEQSIDGEPLFGSITRSSTSIAVTVVVVLVIVALLLAVAGFFLRRRHRRRRQNDRQLASEGGTPHSRPWDDKDFHDDNGSENPFDDSRRASGDSSDAGSDIQPEAVWRRRLHRMSHNMLFGRHNVHVTPLMPSISEHEASSDWTSMVGDHEWPESDAIRSRQGSKDLGLIMTESTAPVAESRHARLLAAVQNPHPLRNSYVPSMDSPSMYSGGDAGSDTSPRALFSYSVPSPPIESTLLRSPFADSQASKTVTLKQSLDRLMGSAADYIGGLMADDSESDRFTTFRSTRRAPPTPIIIPPSPQFQPEEEHDVESPPQLPERAATFTGAATLSPTRAAELSVLKPWDQSPTSSPSPSPPSPLSPGFIGIAHAQIARRVEEESEPIEAEGSEDMILDYLKEDDEEPKDAAGEIASDPFTDDAQVLEPLPPHNPPSSPADRVDTPPPSILQPRLTFLSPFGQRRHSAHIVEGQRRLSAHFSDDSDDGTSTLRGSRRGSSSSATNTIRAVKRMSTSTPLRRSSMTPSAVSSSSSSEEEAEAPSRRGSPRSGSPIQLPADVPIPSSPASIASTDTFGTKLSSATSDDGSDETADSGTSRAFRARHRKMSLQLEEETARRLLSERRRRSMGELRR